MKSWLPTTRCFILERSNVLQASLQGTILDLNPSATQAVDIVIAQDRHKPGLQIGSRLELRLGRQRLQHRVVHQIVGAIAMSRQCPRHCAQVRQMRDKFGPKISYGFSVPNIR